jgi:hypothetical protein
MKNVPKRKGGWKKKKAGFAKGTRPFVELERANLRRQYAHDLDPVAYPETKLHRKIEIGEAPTGMDPFRRGPRHERSRWSGLHGKAPETYKDMTQWNADNPGMYSYMFLTCKGKKGVDYFLA